jgi:hypothetical protein
LCLLQGSLSQNFFKEELVVLLFLEVCKNASTWSMAVRFADLTLLIKLDEKWSSDAVSAMTLLRALI